LVFEKEKKSKRIKERIGKWGKKVVKRRKEKVENRW